MTKAALLLPVAALCACAGFGKSPDVLTDLCAIAKNPTEFEGRTVRVVGVVAPEPHYNKFLYSHECPRTAFIMATSDTVESTNLYESLRTVLWSTYPEKQRSATVNFVAKFVWRPNDTPARIMWVKEITSVQENPGLWQRD